MHRVHELLSTTSHRRFLVAGPPASDEQITSLAKLPKLRERPQACPWEGMEVAELIIKRICRAQSQPWGEWRWTVDVIYAKARKIGQPHRKQEFVE